MEKKYRKKKTLGSYPYVSVVFSIFLSLFVIGLFGLLFLYTSKLTAIIKENIEVQIYLNKNVSNNQRIQIQKTLSAKEYIGLKNEELQISFVSKEEAATTFIEDTGEDFTNFLGENPLRDAYTIKIHPDHQSEEKLALVKEEIESMSGVFEVVYVESLVKSIHQNVTKIGFVLIGFAVILLIIVVILINNTIKLALFSQRFLIRSMQLVGAKPGFIKRPFLVRSSIHGALAGIVASMGLFLLLNFANSKIEDLASLQDNKMLFILSLTLLLLGAIIGFGSTYRAINKYLKLSLDQLY
ncbi:ABC transporter permease [Fulvivirga sp. M361]|uniref:cell division protein FtsX n=1 Tax=Fulvivirga sp. M361 TaxID=2594266 RepID=UPI002106A7D2|nr:permease-like cell division protein FtsX [Fulvivirga sp. M361]